MKFLKSVLIISAAVTLAACKPATVNNIEVISSGHTSSKVVDVDYGKDTHSGTINQVGDVTPLNDSQRVAARLGNGFGLQYVVRGEPDLRKVTVTHSATHPTMTNPETGEEFSGIEHQQEAWLNNTNPSYFGFEFSRDWELVTGEWTLRVSYGDQVVAERTFTVYKPE